MGLFDRLFGQEENQSQETVANQEISETEALDNQDLSTSEGTSESQAEQLSESETQVEEILSTESVEESESTVIEEVKQGLMKTFLLMIRRQVKQRAYQSQKKAKSLWITTSQMSWLITMLKRLR